MALVHPGLTNNGVSGMLGIYGGKGQVIVIESNSAFGQDCIYLDLISETL